MYFKLNFKKILNPRLYKFYINNKEYFKIAKKKLLIKFPKFHFSLGIKFQTYF